MRKWGLVNCDIRLANLLIEGDVTKVVDFEDCGFSWFMYDCVTALSFIEAWMRGYRSIMDLLEENEHEIPTFVMLRRLLLVTWIGSHSETELAQSMRLPYTAKTVGLCDVYLSNFSD